MFRLTLPLLFFFGGGGGPPPAQAQVGAGWLVGSLGPNCGPLAGFPKLSSASYRDPTKAGAYGGRPQAAGNTRFDSVRSFVFFLHGGFHILGPELLLHTRVPINKPNRLLDLEKHIVINPQYNSAIQLDQYAAIPSKYLGMYIMYSHSNSPSPLYFITQPFLQSAPCVVTPTRGLGWDLRRGQIIPEVILTTPVAPLVQNQRNASR